MIRYVPLDEDCLTKPGFAWFDTVTNTFLTFGREQAWDDWSDFLVAHHLEPEPKRDLGRFYRLLPDKQEGGERRD